MQVPHCAATETQVMETSLLVTKPEAAHALAVSIRQLDLYIRDGALAVQRLGRRCVRIERAELERFVRERTGVCRG